MPLSGKKLCVLLAGSGSGEVAAALRALYPEGKDHLELTVVSGVSTLMATLEVVDPELILLDLSLAHPDPLDAVRRVHRAAAAVPLIVLVAGTDKDLGARCLNQGAMDYLLQGCLNPAALERVLHAALAHNTLEGLADLLRDPLTRLYLRDGFLTLGARALETARRKGSTLVLLCLRIENLLAIREEFGPHAVESCLRKAGALLAGSFRRTDLVARLGESQFAALAIDAVEPSGPVLCQRLERRLAILNREMGSWSPLELRLSTGFWPATDASSFPEFLDRVETGLRAAFAGASPRLQEAVSEK